MPSRVFKLNGAYELDRHVRAHTIEFNSTVEFRVRTNGTSPNTSYIQNTSKSSGSRTHRTSGATGVLREAIGEVIGDGDDVVAVAIGDDKNGGGREDEEDGEGADEPGNGDDPATTCPCLAPAPLEDAEGDVKFSAHCRADEDEDDEDNDDRGGGDENSPEANGPDPERPSRYGNDVESTAGSENARPSLLSPTPVIDTEAARILPPRAPTFSTPASSSFSAQPNVAPVGEGVVVADVTLIGRDAPVDDGLQLLVSAVAERGGGGGLPTADAHGGATNPSLSDRCFSHFKRCSRAARASAKSVRVSRKGCCPDVPAAPVAPIPTPQRLSPALRPRLSRTSGSAPCLHMARSQGLAS